MSVTASNEDRDKCGFLWHLAQTFIKANNMPTHLSECCTPFSSTTAIVLNTLVEIDALHFVSQMYLRREVKIKKHLGFVLYIKMCPKQIVENTIYLFFYSFLPMVTVSLLGLFFSQTWSAVLHQLLINWHIKGNKLGSKRL